jgi:GT2 family glycosyltransferase
VRHPESPRLTIVVLSYNRPALLERALQSISRQTFENPDVLVIDNPSPESDRIREVVSRFPEVRLISNTWNSGFTGGMNQGLAEATGEYIYLTEDDIELDRDCVATLVSYLERHPDVALAGPVMWNLGTPTIRCAGGRFTLGSIYQMRLDGVGQRALANAEPFETMYLPGAMIAARTSVLRELGGFHPDFFMYGEDVELCARTLKTGMKIVIVPAAQVHHHEPPEVPVSTLLNFHKQKNLAALYLLHAPARVLPMFMARYVVIDGIKRLLTNRQTLATWARAWGWAARRSPRLLAQRWRKAA